ncbi:unnamed protein product [Echinostoma caproni]|uniref:Alpha-carbonic anhydrase domain-containing protein n=1 Tax=Echinostoma caproni TaxID=27848 RepID=A0A183A5F2_9TREM|nr:unnamed protein product [Echinostoma caproni]
MSRFVRHQNNIVIICNTVRTVWHETSWNVAWDTWWHYKEGAIGGPSYWGHTAHMAYAEDVWRSCHMGKLQSPISISSSDLTYDKSLRQLDVLGKEKQVDMEIHNTGQDVKIELLDTSPPLILTGGPLSYEYRIFGALIKFGSDSSKGSDHQIDGFSFPAEVGEHPSADLSALLATIVDVQLKGQFRRLNGLLMSAILPSTEQFITYQGSIPFPACHETVTWIVLNQAVIITEAQLQALRELRIGPVKESGTMANNFRPVQKLNGRSVRTNIDFEETVSRLSRSGDESSNLGQSEVLASGCAVQDTAGGLKGGGAPRFASL